MPSVRINDGALSSGTGVEGGRKKRPDDIPAAASREPGPGTATEKNLVKPRQGRPRFGDGDSADIFYTKTK
ncbi:hypothetical protein [Methanoculleus sp.]|uniref:hypothetical protein n=1 Tax=Methanoculleus sp. TaxID=90427 RepID=UPI0025E39DEE|nr:hypothetical protein [Methanoculleus sp.]